jgi:3-oxoacyl-[acyl-carrier-protein] synthase-3
MSGLVAFDVAFPSGRVSAKQMHRASGVPMEEILEITHCEEFPALGDDELVWPLALSAARAVLDRASVPASRIRYVIYAGSGTWDLAFWSPAAKVAHELGVTGAHCFEVTNFCNAAMTAVQIACDRLSLGRAEYALVLIGDRLSRMLDYADPESKALFNFGDAGGAILVGRTGYRFELLHSAMRTDPSWSDYYRGGYRDGRVVIERDGHREGLTQAYVDNFARLTEETLTALGRPLSDVAYLLINHGDRRMHERLLETTGLPPERSVFNYHRLGHMGGVDTLIAMQDLMAADRLHRGDLLLLATSAMGFSWGISAVEFVG